MNIQEVGKEWNQLQESKGKPRKYGVLVAKCRNCVKDKGVIHGVRAADEEC